MFEVQKCPICGKTFVPSPLHSLTNGRGKNVCSAHCSTVAYNRRKDKRIERQEREAELVRERDRERKEKKAVEKKERRIPTNNGGIAKPVCIYTKDGEFIKRFPSVNAAARATGIDPSTVSQICRGMAKSRGKYTFCYENAKDIPIRFTRSKFVAQYTVFGDFVARYNSATEASEKTGISISSISQCCTGLQNTAKGYVFRYEEREEQNENENYS